MELRLVEGNWAFGKYKLPIKDENMEDEQLIKEVWCNHIKWQPAIHDDPAGYYQRIYKNGAHITAECLPWSKEINFCPICGTPRPKKEKKHKHLKGLQ